MKLGFFKMAKLVCVLFYVLNAQSNLELELKNYYEDIPLTVYNLYQTDFFRDSSFIKQLDKIKISDTSDGFIEILKGAVAFYDRDKQGAKAWFKKANSQASQNSNIKFYALLNLSLVALNENNNNANQYLDSVKYILNQDPNVEKEAFYHLAKIRLLYKESDYKNVQSSINKIRAILPQIENQPVKLGFYNELGILYGTMHINDESIFYFNKGLDQANELNDELFQGIFLSNIGFGYTQQGLYKQALSYFNRSINKLKTKKMYSTLSNTLWTMGICFEKINKLDSAHFYYDKSFIYHNDDDLIKRFKFVQFLMKNNKQTKAFNELNNLEQKTNKLSVKQNEILFGLLATSYYERKDTLNAFKYLKKWDSIMLSIDNSSIPTVEDYQSAELQFLNNELNKVNQELSKANQIANKKNNVFIIGLVILGSLFVLSIIILVFVTQKNKQLINIYSPQVSSIETINKGLDLDFSERMLSSLRETKDLTKFMLDFELIYPEYFPNLKSTSSKLTKNDLCFLAFDKLKLSHKEIAEILSIELPSVKKGLYRAKKKVNT